ncbi:MAG: hypothetical protein AB7E79_13960 [Rhodospirillaceae bacterium]
MPTVMTVETAHDKATLAHLARLECRGSFTMESETRKRPILGKQRITIVFESEEDRVTFRRALRDLPEPIPDAVIVQSHVPRGGFFARLFG